MASWIPAYFRAFNGSSPSWQTLYINAVRALVVVASQPHGRFLEVMGTLACAGGKGKQPQSSQQIIDPATQNLTILLDYVEQSDLEIFGFVVFRTCYSCDDESWEAFQDGFYDLMDEGIAAASPEFDRIEDRVFMRIVSDDSLKTQSPEDVALAYLVCMEEEEATDSDDEEDWGDEIEPGLTTSMCIMVDEECI